jgi:hypothetical protein
MKVVLVHHKDCDESLPIFFLAYRASTLQGTAELRPARDLLLDVSTDRERSTTNHVVELWIACMTYIHHCARHNLKVASDTTKSPRDGLANCAVFQEGDYIWLYRSIKTTGESPELQPFWGGRQMVIIRINDVINRI